MNILKQFDTVGASNDGAWLHLTVPGGDGEKAYADSKQKKPLRIKLKGPDCDEWVTHMKTARGKTEEKSYAEEAEEDARLFASMTLALENIPNEAGDGDRSTEYNDLVQLYLNYKDVRIQALRFVLNQGNFTNRQPSN